MTLQFGYCFTSSFIFWMLLYAVDTDWSSSDANNMYFLCLDVMWQVPNHTYSHIFPIFVIWIWVYSVARNILHWCFHRFWSTILSLVHACRRLSFKVFAFAIGKYNGGDISSSNFLWVRSACIFGKFVCRHVLLPKSENGWQYSSVVNVTKWYIGTDMRLDLVYHLHNYC